MNIAIAMVPYMVGVMVLGLEEAWEVVESFSVLTWVNSGVFVKSLQNSSFVICVLFCVCFPPINFI